MDQIEVRLEPRRAGSRPVVRAVGASSGGGWRSRKRRVRSDLAAVRGRCLPARDLRHRVPGLGAHPGADGLRSGLAGTRPGLQRAQLTDTQRVDESCYVWDRTGRLVAQRPARRGTTRLSCPATDALADVQLFGPLPAPDRSTSARSSMALLSWREARVGDLARWAAARAGRPGPGTAGIRPVVQFVTDPKRADRPRLLAGGGV